MTPKIMTTIAASRARMLGVLERLHAERDPDCGVWEHWTIPALEGRRMAVEGCRAHDILISRGRDDGPRCESGWTGDRCSLPLHHDGPHSNE